MEAVVQAGRAEALGCELPGDRGAAQALPGQCPDPLRERRVVRQLVDPGHRAPQVSMGLVARAQVTVACTRSVAPSAVTWTDSMTARSSLLRSATVVVGAAHKAGMSPARARIAASSPGDSRAGRARWYRWYSSSLFNRLCERVQVIPV